MLPLVYTHPIAAGIFGIACLIWAVPEMIAMRRQMARISRKAALIQDRNSLGILLGLQYAGLILNFWLASALPAAAIRWQRTALLGIGIVLILLGVGLRWQAIRILGRYFTRDVAVSADQPVVQSGPYRFIRHPAYSGTLLTMLGIGLAMTNWASLAALMLCTFAGHLYRVGIEERALVNTIGQPYLDYMRKTRRFIPWMF